MRDDELKRALGDNLTQKYSIIDGIIARKFCLQVKYAKLNFLQ